MEKIKDVLYFLLIGVVLGTGFRIAQWVIPEPEVRVIVCTVNDFDHVETCTRAADLLNKYNDKQT